LCLGFVSESGMTLLNHLQLLGKSHTGWTSKVARVDVPSDHSSNVLWAVLCHAKYLANEALFVYWVVEGSTRGLQCCTFWVVHDRGASGSGMPVVFKSFRAPTPYCRDFVLKNPCPIHRTLTHLLLYCAFRLLSSHYKPSLEFNPHKSKCPSHGWL
jgi:hypothetical protein